jgi:phosphoribosylformimino-5-aminoimidazole carboxamide ribotide isomerase
MELWPAIDLRGGNCVRLLQGDYAKETVFGSDPVAMVSRFLAGGARRLHIVDLDGAKAGAAVQADLVRRMAEAAGIPCQIGGGIRTAETAEAYLDVGLARVILGSVAVEDPALLERLAVAHPGRIVLGLDARDGRVATRGWVDTSPLLAVDVARRHADLPLDHLHPPAEWIEHHLGAEVRRRIEAERIAEERQEAREDAEDDIPPAAPRWPWLAFAAALLAGLVLAIALNWPSLVSRPNADSPPAARPEP